MPIPCAQAHDVVLGYLFAKQRDDLAAWANVNDIAPPLVAYFEKHQAPGFSQNGHAASNGLPHALTRALRSLQRRRFIDYEDGPRRVRLTNLGAYVALLFSLPPELRTNGLR